MLKKWTTNYRAFGNSQFFTLVACILIAWAIIISWIKLFEVKYNNIKREETIKLIKWWLETYKTQNWIYPEELIALEEEEIIKPVSLLVDWNSFELKYSKTWTWYIISY